MIIYAYSKSKRQMIQRVGKVLRKVPGKKAKVIILYAMGTHEDPREAITDKDPANVYLSDIIEAAEEVTISDLYYRFPGDWGKEGTVNEESSEEEDYDEDDEEQER